MGLIATVLSFVRTFRNNANISDVKVNPGGGANLTCENVSPAGDDAHPLLTDFAVIVPVPRSGGYVAIGYVDPLNVQKALPGDKRIFARNSSGDVVVELWLKNDGSATLLNSNGSATLKPDGGFLSTSAAGTFENSSSGLIKADNGSGFFKLLPNGDFDANGFVISASGDATGTGSIAAPSVKAAGKELAGHTHPVTTAPGTTGPNN